MVSIAHLGGGGRGWGLTTLSIAPVGIAQRMIMTTTSSFMYFVNLLGENKSRSRCS